jgi:YD repeat-containing protein
MRRVHPFLKAGALCLGFLSVVPCSFAAEYDGAGPEMWVEKVLKDLPGDYEMYAEAHLVWEVWSHDENYLQYDLRPPTEESEEWIDWIPLGLGCVWNGSGYDHPHKYCINVAHPVYMEYTQENKDLVAEALLLKLERTLIKYNLVGEWQLHTWRAGPPGDTDFLSSAIVRAVDPCDYMNAAYTPQSGSPGGEAPGRCGGEGCLRHTPSYDSNRSEEESMLGYGWKDGADMTLKILGPGAGRIEGVFELNLGINRSYLTKMDNGQWYAGGPGSKIDVKEISGNVWVRFGFDVAYIFPTPVWDEQNPENKEKRVDRIIEIYRKKTGENYEYEGLETRFSYKQVNSKWRIDKTTDAYGSETTYGYNANGSLKEIRNHNGLVIEEFTYDADGNLATFKDALGNQTSFAYDTDDEECVHKLETVTLPGGQKMFFDFTYLTGADYPDPLTGVWQRVTPYTATYYGTDSDKKYLRREVWPELSWDEDDYLDAAASWRKIRMRVKDDPDVWTWLKYHYGRFVDTGGGGDPHESGYDEEWVLESKTETDYATTTYRYDSTNHRLIWSQLTDGAGYYLTTGYGRDEKGNLTSITTRKEDTVAGQAPDVTYDYDDWDHVTSIKDALTPDPHEICYKYYEYPGASGIPTNMLEYSCQEYDEVQKNKTQYEYYPAGDTNDRDFLLKKVTDPLGKVTTYDYVYDGSDKYFNGRTKTITDPTGSVAQFSYTKDAQGVTTTFYTVPGKNGPRTTSATYDRLGRTSKLKYPPASPSETDVFEVDYSYTGTRLSSVQHSFGSVETKTTTYAYEPSTGWLQEIGEAVGETEEVVTKYTYYVDGSTKTIATDAQGGSKVEYMYDLLGRTTDVKYYVDASNSNNYSYSYYPDGSSKTSIWPNTLGITYEYDATNSSGKKLNLLSKIDYPDGDILDTKVDTTFTYYDNGALNTVKVADNEAITYLYDNYGRVDSVDGALTGDDDYIDFTGYYENGVLSKLRYPDGTNDIEYTIDSLNRLTKINDKPNSKITLFLYDNVTGNLVRTRSLSE